ncbi:SdpI family protein [Patescibacteria group bacterium]
MKIITKKEILPVALITIAFIVGIFLYPILPEKIPSHWNIRGEVDSWSGKNFAVFFIPSLTLGIYFLMTFIPLIDPLRKNYLKFAVPYFCFRITLVLFFVLLYFYSLWAAFKTEPNINYFILPIFSVLFIVIGIFLPKVKKNYFIGIRTPWTIHSEEVWNKTHQFGGKFFIVGGLIALSGLLFPKHLSLIFIIAILFSALIPVAYSYFIFSKIGGFNKETKGRE